MSASITTTNSPSAIPIPSTTAGDNPRIFPCRDNNRTGYSRLNSAHTDSVASPDGSSDTINSYEIPAARRAESTARVRCGRFSASP